LYDASLDFGGQRAFSGISGAVVMFFEEVFYPVIDIIRDGQYPFQAWAGELSAFSESVTPRSFGFSYLLK